MDVHEQEWAKVNVPVDRGVAGLVSALSEFPDLEIIESCEGSEDEPAWICFRFGRYWETKEPWREIAEFALGFLAPQLFERVGDSAALTIGPTGSGGMLADLAVRCGTQQEVQAALLAMAEEYQRREKPFGLALTTVHALTAYLTSSSLSARTWRTICLPFNRLLRGGRN